MHLTNCNSESQSTTPEVFWGKVLTDKIMFYSKSKTARLRSIDLKIILSIMIFITVDWSLNIAILKFAQMNKVKITSITETLSFQPVVETFSSQPVAERQSSKSVAKAFPFESIRKRHKPFNSITKTQRFRPVRERHESFKLNNIVLWGSGMIDDEDESSMISDESQSESSCDYNEDEKKEDEKKDAIKERIAFLNDWSKFRIWEAIDDEKVEELGFKFTKSNKSELIQIIMKNDLISFDQVTRKQKVNFFKLCFERFLITIDSRQSVRAFSQESKCD